MRRRSVQGSEESQLHNEWVCALRGIDYKHRQMIPTYLEFNQDLTISQLIYSGIVLETIVPVFSCYIWTSIHKRASSLYMCKGLQHSVPFQLRIYSG